jgi:hypothetical protein
MYFHYFMVFPSYPLEVKENNKKLAEKIVLSGQQKPGLILDVSTPLGPELHMDVSIQYSTEYRCLCCTWTCLHHLNLSYT